MSDINDLAQKIAFYQAGGKDPGTSTLDKLNLGIDAVGKTINDVLAIKKAALENQKLAGEETPIGSYFNIPSAKDQATQNAAIAGKNLTRVPQNIYPQPSSELENGGLPAGTYGPSQQNPSHITPTPSPMLNARETFQNKYKMSPDTPISDTGAVMKVAAMDSGKPMFISPKGDNISFDPTTLLQGYKLFENVPGKQAATIAAGNANATRPTPVITDQQALDATAAGNAPGKNTRLIRPQAGGPSGGLMSPEDAKLQAQIMMKNGGKMPNMGMGGLPARLQIIHEYTKEMNAAGLGADAMAVQSAAIKAGTEALGKLESSQATMNGFLNSLDKQVGLLSQVATKVNNTGSPAWNRWINSGKTEIAGDTDVNNLNHMVNSINSEYNRAINTVTGGGALADAGVQRTNENLNSAKTLDNILGWASLVKQESQNRRDAFAGEDTTIKSQLYNLGSNRPATTPIPTPSPVAPAGLGGFDASTGKWSDPQKQKRYEAYKAAQSGGK